MAETPPFVITQPKRLTSSVVVASPHSGRDYSAQFLRSSVLDEAGIRSSEDAFVDLLVEPAPDYGAPLISARAPRAFVDLNRSHDELDPAVIAGVRRGPVNPRVSSGLGVIPRVVSHGRSIYRGKISYSEAERRIRDIWHPYHKALDGLLKTARRTFGQAILVDMHSMPHEAIEAVRQKNQPATEIVLGDRFGSACGSVIMDRVQAIFEAEGLKVARNTPFAGAYVTQSYGRPSAGQHALQIEIDRALYMDEAQVRPNANFLEFRDLMHRVVAQIAAIGIPDSGTVTVAAE